MEHLQSYVSVQLLSGTIVRVTAYIYAVLLTTQANAANDRPPEQVQ